jgi:transcriptional regulator with XRE-family HTH domain
MHRMSLGKRIEGARLALGYNNAAAFARQIGIDKQYLWNLENDKVEKPDPARMVALAKGLNVALEWLITGAGSPLTSYTFAQKELEVIAFLKLLPEKATADLLDYAKFLYDKYSQKQPHDPMRNVFHMDRRSRQDRRLAPQAINFPDKRRVFDRRHG